MAVPVHVGFDAERLVVVGGAARNPFWMQNKTDVVGRRIEVPEVEDATPLGAAMLAGIGVGIYPNEPEAYECVRREGPTYEPDLRVTERYARWFETYKMVYPALKPVSHAISDALRAPGMSPVQHNSLVAFAPEQAVLLHSIQDGQRIFA